MQTTIISVQGKKYEIAVCEGHHTKAFVKVITQGHTMYQHSGEQFVLLKDTTLNFLWANSADNK